MIRKPPSVKPRKWACAHCFNKNLPGTKKCGRCGIGWATKRTSLKARCDAMARELCRLLANGRCARCGKQGTDWAHRMPRRHHSVRWSMDNCDFLCRTCHDYFGRYGWEFMVWLRNRGLDVAALERRANEPWDKDYARVLADLAAQLAEAKRRAA